MNETREATAALTAWLNGRGYDVEVDGGAGLSFSAAAGDCLVELDPAGRLLCQFGIDFGELRDLIAGSSTEDLGDDELQRAARYHLLTLTKRYQQRFTAAGFTESYDVTDDHAVITFSHPIVYHVPDDVIPMLQKCLALLA